jgi:hypothetical protein
MDDLTRKALITLTKAALGRQDHAELLELQKLLEHDENLAAVDRMRGRGRRNDDE